jgi:long-chain fatty acid transport protein
MKKFLLIMVLALPLMLAAAGFKNYEIGPRATALGGAFVAGFSDPTSIFYNPAAITGLEGTQFQLGSSFTSRQYSFSTTDFGGLTLESEKAPLLLPEFAVTRRLNRFLWAGVGFHSPTAHKVAWPVEQFNPLVYDARRLVRKTWTVTPALAFKLSERFSIGASLGINFASAEMIRHLDFDMLIVTLSSGRIMDAQDFILTLRNCRKTYLSFGLGMRWKWSGRLSFGFSAEGGLARKYAVGDLVFREPDTPFADINRRLREAFIDSPAQKARATFNDIATFRWGLAWKANERLNVEADVYLAIWEMFDTVAVLFETPISISALRIAELEGDFTWKNPLSLRIGAEYRVSDRIVARLGFFAEPSPVPDEQFSGSFPFSEQWGLAAGVGWRTKNLTLSAAYRYLGVAAKRVMNGNVDLEMIGLTDIAFAARSEHLFSIGLSYAILGGSQ